MKQNENNGYVYILEVKDIVLPVCKIGYTTRIPSERCEEINANSSTGDFIWKVAHYMRVNDCKGLESIVHTKLAPLRQKRREFFNVTANDAYSALISILDGESEFKEIAEEPANSSPAYKSKRKLNQKRKHSFKSIDPKYAELLQIFCSLLKVKGRPFGQLNKPGFGISDGNEGVQWNLSVLTDTGQIRLGVNLEGKRYINWPISTLIQEETAAPGISVLANLSNAFVQFTRDAWQATARPPIVEKYIGGREFSLAEIGAEQWRSMLKEALDCLDENRNYRGRAKQEVTLITKNGHQVRCMEVSPHLRIWTPFELSEDNEQALREKMNYLRPVCDWFEKKSGA